MNYIHTQKIQKIQQKQKTNNIIHYIQKSLIHYTYTKNTKNTTTTKKILIVYSIIYKKGFIPLYIHK